ncbi:MULTISPECIES: alpha/beta hydrolase family protein [unclassified Streptomyces]|uniref:alpha/beta hydrolase family protein n=1 Tax=unclassified Streptomyces TaxID=2593676 RepID=UPI0037FA9C2F
MPHLARPSAPSRRRVMATGTALAAGLALTGAGAGATTAAAATPSGSAPAPVRLALPRPTGPHALGTVTLHLTDRSRRDPWVGSVPVRELMVQIWYPALRGAGLPRAPWMDPKAAEVFQRTGYLLDGYVTLPPTHARTGAPADLSGGRLPVILYSHGHGQYRASSTALVEDLVSHGYVVVTIDHTYDAGVVEFPGGRVTTHRMPELTEANMTEVIDKAVDVRVADTRFVREELSRRVRARGNPLPARLGELLDLSRTALFGHSLGGATAAAAMAEGMPFLAGANLDGHLFGPALTKGVPGPFLLIGEDAATNDNWTAAWPKLRGWRRMLLLTGSRHFSYTDYEAFLPQALDRLGGTAEQLAEVIGPLDSARSIAIQRRFLRAYFDLHLRGRRARILEGPTGAYPEMRFLG